MNRCFVMQPFDGGVFDNRYEDIIGPAITDAGLDPYRVDRDPNVSIPIDDIVTEIRQSRLCLADITLDNPNVWFELGFAIASGKGVILVCSDQRQSKFPFDVQHRSIIRYGTGAPRDFVELRKKITERVKALLRKDETLSAVTDISATRKIEGLEQHEVVTMAAIGENIDTTDDVATVYQIRRDMELFGFTRLATTMALKTLHIKGMIEDGTVQDETGDPIIVYSFTQVGWTWILANKHQFVLQHEKVSKGDVPF